MEPQFSVLLYSKYSATSKNLMDIMKNSGVNFSSLVGLQPLCVDNEEVRNRILQNEQISVSSVPCILVIFPDGGIEKYDDIHSFNWIEQIITKYSQQQPQQQHQQQPQQQHQQQTQMSLEEEDSERNLREQEQTYKQKMKDIEMEKNRREFEERKRAEREPVERPKEQHENMRIHAKQNTQSQSPDRYMSETTAISDLPSDEDDELSFDRYRHRKPVARIRENSGNYTEDADLFPGTPPSTRKHKRSAIKDANKSTNNTGSDIMAKAKELAKGRENDSPPPPPGHPANQHN